MPLEPYRRGDAWWARGRVELDGQAITPYRRISTGASTEAGARDWIAEETVRQRRRYIIGDAPDALTFDDAVVLYPAKPAEAAKLMRILPHLTGRTVASITPKELRSLGATMMPNCATDTWWREIVTPVRSVINNAHDEGKCPPIRVRGYSSKERMEQDTARGKQSRVERTAADRDWLAKFMAHADVYNAALAAFMFETAARVGQAVQLRPRDLDLMNGRVWLAESKGHPAQWVAISRAMVVRLANLKAKRPRARSGDRTLPARVFGYASSTGMHERWRTICKNAVIPYLPPHQAGRHGFYTEMRVRQGLDPISAAKAGRWADATLPDRVYAHSDLDERKVREAVSTKKYATKKAK
ncbi:site-specific integrase [Loktanella sp. TSTF-M6]|uniref:Site-specific integrase n=1 Tax=Loktanella gaetbuli TaxID=2881335 RepID=A0ABS8BTK4_9RHOB|nr:tyrosine-type recombinase/integrase [Loktanella gaetbuli]MCB5199053.1 site-specific integrase [Loktanella gaetbuli]